MNAELSQLDALLEAQIDEAYRDLLSATTREAGQQAFGRLREYVAQRSPERVREMESRIEGLRA